MKEILFKDLAYRIIGAGINVYNQIGPFLQEPAYQTAMEIELSHQGIPYSAKHPVSIVYREFLVATGQIDFLVDDSVVLELKAASAIHPRHVSQVIQYLSAIERPLGLILNFGNIDRLESRRVPFSRNLERLRSERARTSSEAVGTDDAR